MADDLNLTQYLLENPLYNYGGQLRQQGSQMGPVLSWQEGLARALQGTAGGAFQGLANYQALGERRADQQAIQNATQLMGQGKWDEARAMLGTRPNTAPYAMQLGLKDADLKRQLDLYKGQQEINRQGQQEDYNRIFGGGNQSGAAGYQSAIADNESAGQPNGGYGAVGPTTPMKDGPHKPYGKYQVMDFNVGPWTKEALGKEMTPEEFLQNPQAQDAVFNKKFGQYLNQYGNPQDAASAWFSGQPLRSAGDRPDVLGTTPQSYVQKFSAGLPPPSLGPSTPPQVSTAQATQPAAQAQPAQGTINYGGVQVPIGPLKAALSITDMKGRQEAVSRVVSDAQKQQFEGQPGEWVQGAAGEKNFVPRAQLAGRTSIPEPGTKAGDLYIVNHGDPNSTEYKQAVGRLYPPQLSQMGQVMQPTPVLPQQSGQQGYVPPQPSITMSPEGKIKATSDLAAEFNKNDAVQKTKTMEPWLTAIDQAIASPERQGEPSGQRDMQILQSYYRLMNPGSERPSNAEMIKGYGEMGSLPEELRKKMQGVIEGKTILTAPERAKMQELGHAQFNAFKGSYDRAVENMRGRLKANPELDLDAIIGAPLTAQPSANPIVVPGGVSHGPLYDINGKRIGG